MSHGVSTVGRIRLAWYQYRLRTLLVLMAAIAVWLGVISSRARRQKYVVDRIRALGGMVDYDFQKRIGGHWGTFNFKNPPPGPDWLRRLAGDDYFETVVAIILQNRPVKDGDLALLDRLPNANALEFIAWDHVQISNDGMAHFERFHELRGLNLAGDEIDDRGLVHLRQLTNLRYLILVGTKITDAGVPNLQGLVNLEDELGLSYTQITDASVKYFKNFKKLRSIDLLHTKVTERGARELKQALPNCSITYTKDGKFRSL